MIGWKIIHGQISTESQNSSEANQPISKCLGGQTSHLAKENIENNENLENIVKSVKMLLHKVDRMDLSEHCFGTASDSNDVSWDQAHQVFYENKYDFVYNMSRLQTLEIPIAILQARHNCSEAKKKYSREANCLHSCLYLAKGSYVMLTYSLLTPIGLHNGARGKVIDFVYMNSNGN